MKIKRDILVYLTTIRYTNRTAPRLNLQGNTAMKAAKVNIIKPRPENNGTYIKQ